MGASYYWANKEPAVQWFERSMNNSTLAHVELDEGAVPNLGCCPAGGSGSRLRCSLVCPVPTAL